MSLAATGVSSESPVGGANSPAPSPPPKLVIETAELDAGSYAIKVPTGTYVPPAQGAPAYSIPGPIVSFKGADGLWRGHGYLETYPRLLKFTGTKTASSAELAYEFEGGKAYKVSLAIKDGAVLLTETSTLGPRNIWVFDCYYGGDNSAKEAWQPGAGLALDRAGEKQAFLYLPCFYDKPEVLMSPALKPAGAAAPEGPRGPFEQGRDDTVERLNKGQADFGSVGAMGVVSAEAGKKDLAGFWMVDLAGWKNPDAMGVALWQHRQRPGDPASRHFLGPETKSDSTPNPRTAGLLGTSLYEGHVTIELQLGNGTRKIGFAAPGKGPTKEKLAEPFKAVVKGTAGK